MQMRSRRLGMKAYIELFVTESFISPSYFGASDLSPLHSLPNPLNPPASLRKKTQLVGYDGVSPGPTFRMEKGREAVVRFINKGVSNSSIHLHGSYSRAPFDGWAEDTTDVGQFKDYCE